MGIRVTIMQHGMREKFWTWLAWRLPKPLVYWAAVRLITRATVGEYRETKPLELTANEALQRWERRL